MCLGRCRLRGKFQVCASPEWPCRVADLWSSTTEAEVLSLGGSGVRRLRCLAFRGRMQQMRPNLSMTQLRTSGWTTIWTSLRRGPSKRMLIACRQCVSWPMPPPRSINARRQVLGLPLLSLFGSRQTSKGCVSQAGAARRWQDSSCLGTEPPGRETYEADPVGERSPAKHASRAPRPDGVRKPVLSPQSSAKPSLGQTGSDQSTPPKS